MSPVVLLILGVLIVVGGVLALRMHAFLRCCAAALAIASLTPTETARPFLLRQRAFALDAEELAKRGASLGMRYLILHPNSDGGVEVIGELELTSTPTKEGVVSYRVLTEGVAVKPGHLVIHPLDAHAATSAAKASPGSRVALAVGDTCGKIALIIAMAAIIGKCMLESGSADRIVRGALAVTGPRGVPLAFTFSGFVLGVPVFFDTVFYLMIPLGKAMRLRTGGNYLLYVLSIVCGATMAHSLVPPTPGPLLVAEELHVDLGKMIVFGCMVGLAASAAGLGFAYWISSRCELPLRESVDLSMEKMQELADRPARELPPLALALAPVVLPVVLIAGHTVWKAWVGRTPAWATTLGDKNLALTLSALIALGTLMWSRRTSLGDLADAVQQALAGGGVIILITSAGGAFGAMLQQSGVIDLVRQIPTGSSATVLIMAFLVTAAVRTAQGSATVAMITAVGVLSGFQSAETLGCDPVYLACAIGCGSKPIAWMNDSGFWVICKMSGMSEAEGLRYITPMSTLMGLAGLLATLALAWLAP